MKFPSTSIAAAAACCFIMSTDAFVLSTSNNAAFRPASTKTSSSSLQAQIFSVSSNHVAIGDTIVENPNKGKKNGEEVNGAISTASLERNISSKNEEVETKQATINGAVTIESEKSTDGPSEPIKEINGIKMSTDGKVAPRPKKKERSTAEPTKSSSTDAARTTTTTTGGASFTDRIANSGAASAAAMATAAVNAAVAMKSLDAPDVSKSYISLDKTDNALDEEGLPLVYDKDLIEQYWRKERGALNKRWSYFVGKAVPFLSKLVGLFIADGKIEDRHIPGLSEQARIDLQDLGPTFIKLGQMMSVRPDVLPQPTLDELSMLQDSVVPFDTTVAVQQIESELGGPLGQFFTSISEEPVAAASLAQVYLATLNDGKSTKVAVKVQRPDVLSTVSKDLYVLRRAAEVFQGLVERFAPQQKTNYVALLNEWAIGFYTELDFENEARNQITLRNMLRDKGIKNVTVPAVYEDLCTRRILVSEWMDGKKLSDCSDEEIGEITPIAQESFLTQLFEVGFFHAGKSVFEWFILPVRIECVSNINIFTASHVSLILSASHISFLAAPYYKKDPHPGNILKLNEPTEEGYTVALIDCGLMARIDQNDRDNMISAVIHLANKDYASLVDDFISLKILPADSDRAAIIPLMDKALKSVCKGRRSQEV